MSETAITEALARGALADAATLIVEGYGPGILGYVAALVRDDDEARDVFSEFGEELWKALPRFGGKSSVKTWAYAIAYHCALRQRRSKARRNTRPLRDSEYSKVAQSVRSMSLNVSRADAKLEVLRSALNPKEHTLLVLRLDRQMSWEDIAEVMGSKPPAVRKQFQRLKERLRAAAAKL
jgi:RNA polymerase sigma-70 factor (ECF subfamily)